MSDPEQELMTFPCRFPIKAMGRAEPGFDLIVVELIRRHIPNLHEGAVVSRSSKGGKWVSVTVTIQAESKAQLDAIYRDLSAHDKIHMAL